MSRKVSPAPSADATTKVVEKKACVSSIQRERRLAKNTMAVSLGTLVLTGYMLGRGGHHGGAKTAHIVAGVALLGAAYWHSTLYTPAAVRVGTLRDPEPLCSDGDRRA